LRKLRLLWKELVRVHFPIRWLGDLKNFGPPPTRKAFYDKTMNLRAKENAI